MGIYGAQQQAAQAQASMDMQAAQMEQQMNMQAAQQRQQMQQNQQLQQQSLIQQQQQAYQARNLQQQQAAQQYNLQVSQANTDIQNQYNQQLQAVQQERAQIMQRDEFSRQAYQRNKESSDKQIRFNNEAANRLYVQEQSKQSEAKKKAAFANQDALVQMIGAKGAILSAGRTGQSVGLLVNDVERQAGFAEAKANASLASSMEQSAIAMQQGFYEAQSANAQVDSNRTPAPTEAYLPSLPNIPEFIKPQYPDYTDTKSPFSYAT